jgi:hypothetical protein
MKLRNLAMYRLMAPEGGDAGGGAGGTAGAGGDDKGDKGSEIISESMKAFVAGAINNAINNWSKRSETKTGELIKNSIGEALKGFRPAAGDDYDGGQGDDDKGKSTGGRKPDPNDPTSKEIARLRSENEKILQKLTAEEKARADERESRARAEERQVLADELRKANIPDARIKGAVAYLTHDVKAIRRNSDGAIVWPVKRDYGDEDVNVATGVAEWLKTEEGKAYLPPVEASGSGNRGGRGAVPKAGEKMTDAQAKVMLGQAMAAAGGDAKTGERPGAVTTLLRATEASRHRSHAGAALSADVGRPDDTGPTPARR